MWPCLWPHSSPEAPSTLGLLGEERVAVGTRASVSPACPQTSSRLAAMGVFVDFYDV